MHEHNFEVETPDDYGAEWDGDGGVVAYVHCNEMDVAESYTDPQRDEVYEVYEDPCQATLSLYWEIDEVLVIDDGEEKVTESTSIRDSLLARTNLDDVGRDFVAMANSLEPGDETVHVVNMMGEEYEVVWVLEDAHISG